VGGLSIALKQMRMTARKAAALGFFMLKFLFGENKNSTGLGGVGLSECSFRHQKLKLSTLHVIKL
jgi:hypothetical protein